LAASDIVTVTVYDIFTVADTVSAKDGGTFSSNVTFNGNINAGTIKEATGTTTAMTIDSSGRVLLPQVPCCHVRLTLSNSQDTTNPYTTLATNIKFDSIELNQGSCYSASTGEFTCPVAGVYAADVHFLSSNGATIDHEIKLLHNSTTVHFGYNGVDSNYVPLRANGLIDCAAGDTISVQLTQGQIYMNASGVYSSFTVRLVG
jgi:hypothetical protein